ncbi:MAG: hypothetical protein P8Y43_00630 [Sulfurovaceae bacterium]
MRCDSAMQYDLDIKSKYAQTFKTIRKILLSYPQIQEFKNAKQTSYSDEYGVVVMMRAKKEHLVVAFGGGYKLQEKFPKLQGSGKIVRHLYFKASDSVDEALLREMIEESFILGLEADEIKRLRGIKR